MSSPDDPRDRAAALWASCRRPLHVGVDATAWTNWRGFGRHTRALVSALVRVDRESRYTLFVDTPAARDTAPPGVDVRLVPTRRPTTDAAVAGGRRSLGDLARMSRALADPALDVLLYPTVYSYVPVLSRARKLVTLHDVTAEVFPQLALGGTAARVFWRIKVAVARRQADTVLTHSEFSRQGLVERLGLDPARVVAIGAGADPVFRVLEHPEPTPALRAQGLASQTRWLVYVGGISPHKRLDLLVDVFSELTVRFPDLGLVIVGDYANDGFHSGYPALRAQIRRLGVDSVVRFTGFLDDADLAVLLNRAAALVLPSMIEGFGLPALEAAACGCPAVVTSASPLPEALGAAVLPVRPGSRDDLTRALTRVLGDARLRATMRSAGPPAAAAHTWERAAERVAVIIRERAHA